MLQTSTISEESFRKLSAKLQTIYKIINLSWQSLFCNVKLYILNHIQKNGQVNPKTRNNLEHEVQGKLITQFKLSSVSSIYLASALLLYARNFQTAMSTSASLPNKYF